MDRITAFLRSELFLSLAGGFALGLVAMSVVKPASAGIGDDAGRSVTVSATDYGTSK
jgi:hypothetical protein